MVIKRKDTVEITPDLWETKKKTKTKTKRRKKLSKEEEEEEGTPLRAIFCLKTRQDMKIFEEKEDCFILDFDPSDSFDARKLSFPDNPEGDNDVAVLHEKGQVLIIKDSWVLSISIKFWGFSHPFRTVTDLGFRSVGFSRNLEGIMVFQVACRDYPHPRHLCSKFSFGSTLHETHCDQCYCYVCDVAAPCAEWTCLAHCEALEDSRWKHLRDAYRNVPSLRQTTNK